MFVADNPDSAGNFYAHSDEVANNLWPYPSFEQKAYYLSNYTNSTDMKNAIISGINQGALFVTYNGHSSKRTWGDGFFDRVDINSLSNTVFPIFLPMTCLEGQFINPGFISMGEQAVRTPGKGAVASFSPTGLGVATGHQFLYNTFFQALDGGETELGALTVAAKQALFESHSLFRDLLDTYILLGDPALHVQVPSANPGISKTVLPGGSIGPGDVLTYTLTYQNTGLITATNVVITDILPAGLINPSTTSAPSVTPDAGPTYVWSLGDLAPGAGGVITVTAQVDPGLSGVSSIDNMAQIATDTIDGNTNNNEATVTSPLGAPITLGGVTWFDSNGDRVIQGSETNRVPSVPITVTRVSDSAVFTTVSDGNGDWVMNNLPAGTYVVTAATPGSLVTTTPDPVPVTLASGQSRLDINFGYITPTAVEIASFAASREPAGVVLRWRTSFEENLVGFYIYRAPAAGGDMSKLISDLITSNNDPAGASYTFVDRTVDDTGWQYWLQAVDVNGERQQFGPILVPPPDDGSSQRLFMSLIVR